MASSRKIAPTEGDGAASVQDALREVTAAASAPSSSIGIAFSGGLDSSVLLDGCVAVFGAARCVAFHIHHGLQTAADDWLTHCEAVCARLGVAFVARRVVLPAGGAGEGIEAAARQARYGALRALATAHGTPIVLLGHHADDQAETVMLQLLRGTGMPGLAAMPTTREDDHTSGLQWGRPLLALTRETLERYAQQRGLRWIDDMSNDDRRFVRNALRHDVMPAIATHFPAYRTTLARVARHAAASQNLLVTLAEEDRVLCRAPVRDVVLASDVVHDEDAGFDTDTDAGVDADVGADVARAPASDLPAEASVSAPLSLTALRALSPARIENLLRHWIRLLGLPAPSSARLAEMLAQIAGKARTPVHRQRASIEHAGQWLHIYRERVYWSPSAGAASGGRVGIVGATGRLRFDGQPIWSPPGWRGHYQFVITATVGTEAGEGTVFETPAQADAWVVPLSALLGRELEVRVRAGGERMRLGARRPLRSLKQLYQAAAVPAWQRDVPLLYVDGTLCYVPYVGGFLAETSENDAPMAADRAPVLGGEAQMLTIRWCPVVD